MATFLPSEVARLILGYMEAHDYSQSAHCMMEELPELEELFRYRKRGWKSNSRLMDVSLIDILDDYCQTKDLIQDAIDKFPNKYSFIKRIDNLHEQVRAIIDNIPQNARRRSVNKIEAYQKRLTSFASPSVNLLREPFNESTQTPHNNETSVNTLLEVDTTQAGNLPGLSNHLQSHNRSPQHDSFQCLSELSNNSLNTRKEKSLLNESVDIFSIEPNPMDHDVATPHKRKGGIRKKAQPSPKSTARQGVSQEGKDRMGGLLKNLLENTALHEKIADNINKTRNRSTGDDMQHSRSPQKNLDEAFSIGSSANSAQMPHYAMPNINDVTSDPLFESLLEELDKAFIQVPAYTAPTSRLLNTPVPSLSPHFQGAFSSSESTNVVPFISENTSFMDPPCPIAVSTPSTTCSMRDSNSLKALMIKNGDTCNEKWFPRSESNCLKQFNHTLPVVTLEQIDDVVMSSVKKDSLKSDTGSVEQAGHSNSTQDTSDQSGLKENNTPNETTSPDEINSSTQEIARPISNNTNGMDSNPLSTFQDLMLTYPSCVPELEEKAKVYPCQNDKELSNHASLEVSEMQQKVSPICSNDLESVKDTTAINHGGMSVSPTNNSCAPTCSENYDDSSTPSSALAQFSEQHVATSPTPSNPLNPSITSPYSPSRPMGSVAMPVSRAFLPNSKYFSGTPDHPNDYTYAELQPLSNVAEESVVPPPTETNSNEWLEPPIHRVSSSNMCYDTQFGDSNGDANTTVEIPAVNDATSVIISKMQEIERNNSAILSSTLSEQGQCHSPSTYHGKCTSKDKGVPSRRGRKKKSASTVKPVIKGPRKKRITKNIPKYKTKNFDKRPSTKASLQISATEKPADNSIIDTALTFAFNSSSLRASGTELSLEDAITSVTEMHNVTDTPFKQFEEFVEQLKGTSPLDNLKNFNVPCDDNSEGNGSLNTHNESCIDVDTARNSQEANPINNLELEKISKLPQKTVVPKLHRRRSSSVHRSPAVFPSIKRNSLSTPRRGHVRASKLKTSTKAMAQLKFMPSSSLQRKESDRPQDLSPLMEETNQVNNNNGTGTITEDEENSTIYSKSPSDSRHVKYLTGASSDSSEGNVSPLECSIEDNVTAENMSLEQVLIATTNKLEEELLREDVQDDIVVLDDPDFENETEKVGHSRFDNANVKSAKMPNGLTLNGLVKLAEKNKTDSTAKPKEKQSGKDKLDLETAGKANIYSSFDDEDLPKKADEIDDAIVPNISSFSLDSIPQDATSAIPFRNTNNLTDLAQSGSQFLHQTSMKHISPTRVDSPPEDESNSLSKSFDTSQLDLTSISSGCARTIDYTNSPLYRKKSATQNSQSIGLLLSGTSKSRNGTKSETTDKHYPKTNQVPPPADEKINSLNDNLEDKALIDVSGAKVTVNEPCNEELKSSKNSNHSISNLSTEDVSVETQTLRRRNSPNMMTFTHLPYTPEKTLENICQSAVKEGLGLVAFPTNIDDSPYKTVAPATEDDIDFSDYDSDESVAELTMSDVFHLISLNLNNDLADVPNIQNSSNYIEIKSDVGIGDADSHTPMKKQIFEEEEEEVEDSSRIKLPPISGVRTRSLRLREKESKTVSWLSDQFIPEERDCKNLSVKTEEWEEESVEPGEKHHDCQLCSKKFFSMSHLQRHILTHTGEMTYGCTHCNKKFKQKDHLRRHISIHTGETPYECSHCSKQFKQNTHLQAHILTHTGERPFNCSHCSKQFRQREHLRAHITIHSGEKPFVCHVCDSKFRLKCHLKKHIPTHAAKDFHKCPHCSKKFRFKGEWNKHILNHPGGELYECHYCNKRFKRKAHLELHVIAHTGEKSYDCHQCGKKFDTKSHLQRHMFTHTGEKPFECSDCGKRFNVKSNLRAHASTHTGERPYECLLCNKKFRERKSLRNHISTHAEEDPYFCPHCYMKFKWTAQLQSHILTHEGE